MGASELHIAVSQAIKNLGHLNPSNEELEAKMRKWQETYNNDDVEPDIKRIIRATADVFQQALTNSLLFPDTIRRVYCYFIIDSEAA